MKLDLELELEKLKDKYKELYKKKPSSRAKYIWRYDKDYKRWYNFLSQFKDEKILDFGSGAGIALRAGLDNDLNITGLDIYSPNVYEDMRNVLKVSPIIYDGVNIPFNTKFDIIIFINIKLLMNMRNIKDIFFINDTNN